VLTREDGSKKHFRIYGRPTPNVGDIVTLPIDGRLIKARIREIPRVASADHVDAAEIESTEPA
jgi:hypothetical protein